jgi:hypothetical protein
MAYSGAMITWSEPLLWFLLTFVTAQLTVLLSVVLKPLFRWWREHVRIVGRRG